MGEARLRDIARQFIGTGRLPSIMPRRLWGGPGVGIECPLCELAVTGDQQEMQAEFVTDHDIYQVCHFHTRCFAAWALEQP